MKAQDARLLAQAVNEKSQIDEVEKRIKSQASIGAFSTHTENPLISSDISHFQQAGYQVEYSEINRCHKISW